MASGKKQIRYRPVKNRKKAPLSASFVLAYNLKEIKLAKDATKEPNPPVLTPKSSSVILPENGNNISVAGTLLITWLTITAAGKSAPEIFSCRKTRTGSISAMFPVKIKKQINVSSNIKSTFRKLERSNITVNRKIIPAVTYAGIT